MHSLKSKPKPKKHGVAQTEPILNLPAEDDKHLKVDRDCDLHCSLSKKERRRRSRKILKAIECQVQAIGDVDESKHHLETLSSLRFDESALPTAKSQAATSLVKLKINRRSKTTTTLELKDNAEPTAMQRTGSQQSQDTIPLVNGMNGTSGAANGAPTQPIHAGQQMDLNFIYSKVLELSEQLRANREQTQGLIAGAEELASRAATTGNLPDAGEANSQLNTARVADLSYKLAEAEAVNKTLFREQRENGKLIGEYEQALEKVVTMLRDYAYNKESEKNNLAKQYLNTLQSERDEHFKTRLERDTANTHILKLMAQMRQAYHLSVEESCPDVEIVAGLQNEVRSLRNALGLSKERFEEETGYPVLQHVRGGPGEEDD